MKIAIVTPVFLPYHSGISQVAAQEAVGLAARGHEVTVFTPNYGPRNQQFQVIGYKLQELRPFFKFGKAAFLPQLLWRLRGFDVIQLHYPFFGSADVAAWSARLNQIPFVVTYHMDVVGRGVKGLIFKLYTKFFLLRLIRRANKVIVSTLDYARSSALAPFLSAEPEKFMEIMFGVDTAKFCPPPQTPKEKKILFVAALDRAHYFKGLDRLLQSIYQLKVKSYKLVIVGEGELRKNYEKQTRDLGLTDQVEFVGRVSEDELIKYYQQAAVLAVPSLDRSEAFSLSALQALACGLPVIASDLPGLRQVVGNRGLVVPPGDATALADALKKLLTDDNLRSQLSSAARSFVVDSLNIKEEIDQLELVIDKARFN